MSEVVNVPLGKDLQSLDTSPKFDGYSAVEIVNEDGSSTVVGNPKTGRTLTVSGISTSDAQALLTRITGFRYQPYDANGALLNPAAEIGDGVTVNGVYSGIYKMTKKFSPLMAAYIAAPQDEELDHEYPYEPKQDRVFKREIQEAYSRITQTESAITSEVARATEAEGSLSSRITQTASEINATVSGKLNASGGSASTFGWTLNSYSWSLKANNTVVFSVNKDGAKIAGNITAKTGNIGGFTITDSSLYNGPSSLSKSTRGVYVGNDGIRINGTNSSYFRASSSGNVEANNLLLTGALYFGNKSTYLNASTVASLLNTVSQKNSSWSTGANYGYNYNNAVNSNSASTGLRTKCLAVETYFSLGGYDIGRTTVIDGNGHSKNVLGWTSR